MNPRIHFPTTLLLMLIPLGMIGGCDDQVSQVAREAADRQAQQNTAMADLQKEVATGTQKLVSADSQARQEIIGVHHDLQEERSRLDTGWTELNGERRQMAGERKTESMWVSVTSLAGGILLVALLLVFCRHVLLATHQKDASTAELHELLVEEVLTNPQPQLTATEQALTQLGVQGAQELQE